MKLNLNQITEQSINGISLWIKKKKRYKNDKNEEKNENQRSRKGTK